LPRHIGGWLWEPAPNLAFSFMATRIASRLTAVHTVKQVACRPIASHKPFIRAVPPQTTFYYPRRYWSSTGTLKNGENINAERLEQKNAFDVLSTDSGPSNVVSSADPDLDIELPSNMFADRSNQPQLINIPPQQDPLLAYLASRLMNHGHRAKASRIVSRTLLNIHAYTRAPPLPILRQAIFACAPAVRLLKHRHSTKTIYKPVAVSEKQGIFFAVTWLLEEIKGRQGGPMVEERLAREIIKVIKGESGALKKKEDVHKMAMVNRGNIATTHK
jgi:small subunit ribosomal protein S7